MNKPVKVLLYYFSFLLLLTNCRENPHFERPETLEPPMYQQLEARGNFKHFLALVDKANYTQSLSGAGYYTLFAPNDAAFEAYFQEKGISGIDAIDAETARAIVAYSLVYNAYSVERLSDYQNGIGWEEDEAFKRKTAYYDGVYTAQNVEMRDGQVIPSMSVINRNRHTEGAVYVVDDNGNKYIPYFTEDYFSAKGLSAADYNFFYPNTTYVGFNVAGAQVVEANVFAENGYIHIIDKVIEPLPNAAQHLATKDEYSAFRGLMEKYLADYESSSPAAVEITRRNAIRTGSADPVYIKSYNSALVFAPNNENWQDPEAEGAYYEHEAQSNSNTLFAPTNAAVNAYVDNVLLQYYKTDEQGNPQKTDISMLPQSIIADFVSAHMWSNPVWPTRFGTTRNAFGDPARFDPAADVKETQMLSNGFFYGTDKVLESNVFHSVYGRAYLDPKYSMMIEILGLQAKKVFTQKDNLYTMFLISNKALTEAGYTYDTRFRQWVYTPPQGGAQVTGSTAKTRLDRLIYQHIALVENMDELTDLSGTGMIRTYGEEYIKYENNTLYTAGNTDLGEVVNILPNGGGPIRTENGIVYLLDRVLEVSDKHVVQHIQENFGDTHFWNLISNSFLYLEATETLEGTTAGSPYTVFIPADSAVEKAAAAGLLPVNADGSLNLNPASADEQDLVANFIRYHIVANAVVVDKGPDLPDISYQTLFKNLLGETGLVNISDGTGGAGPTVVRDMRGNEGTVHPESSNVLSNWAVIHVIDNYLDYRTQ